MYLEYVTRYITGQLLSFGLIGGSFCESPQAIPRGELSLHTLPGWYQDDTRMTPGYQDTRINTP